MVDALQLNGWKTIGIKYSADTNERTITAEYVEQPTACLKCGVIGRLYKHGFKDTAYIDSPAFNGSIKIIAKRQRYRCRDCESTFLQPVGGVDDERRMTSRCIDYIRSRCFKAPYSHIAGDLGCDPKTVSGVTEGFVELLNTSFKPVLPEWLGLDETKLAGDFRCIITDVVNRVPVDIIDTRRKDAVYAWLLKNYRTDHVKGVAIDMWRPYKDAVHAVYKVPVVIDKFHVVRLANFGLDKARIALGKGQTQATNKSWKKSRFLLHKRPEKLNLEQSLNLDGWLQNEEGIATAYQIKESFYSIYDMPKDDAILAYDEWRSSMPKDMKKHFSKLLSATKNWRTEILAYFDHPVTNGYTESLNGVAKVVNRMGRGYSYDVIRARILFSKLPHVIKPPMRQYAGGHRYSRVYDWPICGSCRGEYTHDELTVADIEYPETGRIHKLPLCPECVRRFHG